MSCWNLRESPLAPAFDSEFPPQSTSALLFDEGDPLSQPKGNIAASSVDPTAGECPASPASNFDDMPPDGKSVKGNVKAPPQTPQFTASSEPPSPLEVMAPVHTCSSVGSVWRSLRHTQRA